VPPLPVAAQVVRVALSGLTLTHPWANIINLKYTGTQPSNSQLDTLCTNISTLWSTAVAPSICTSTSLTQVVAQDLTNASAAVGISNAVHPGTHTATVPASVNVSLCVTWKTAMRWRGGHGRSYWPGQDAAEVQNGNTWVPGWQTQAQVNASTFMTGLNSLTAAGNSWSFVILRRHQTLADGSHVPLDPPIPVPVTGVIVDSRVDSQRRRLGRDVTA
jgi:hypothetical protein